MTLSIIKHKKIYIISINNCYIQLEINNNIYKS